MLAELARAAGARRAIEEACPAASSEAGLDHYRVRRYPAWYRHLTLARAAAAHLTALRAVTGEKGGHRGDLVRPSGNELRRLLTTLAHPLRHETDPVLHWSRRRRRHQHRARLGRYRRRGHRPP